MILKSEEPSPGPTATFSLAKTNTYTSLFLFYSQLLDLAENKSDSDSVNLRLES